MGYSTRFKGGVSGPKELLDVFVDDANSGSTYGEYGQPLDDWYTEFFGGGTAKWYGWENDLTNVSATYPNLLFWLEGEGEDAGDLWKAWARNGKVVTVRAKIVFDEPDLDTEIPSANAEEEIAQVKAKKKREIEKQIERLTAERDALC